MIPQRAEIIEDVLSRCRGSFLAVALTTRMLTEYANDPDIVRAEALRRSMLALLMEHEDLSFAHPFYRAPFVIVGEGGIPDPALSDQ